MNRPSYAVGKILALTDLQLRSRCGDTNSNTNIVKVAQTFIGHHGNQEVVALTLTAKETPEEQRKMASTDSDHLSRLSVIIPTYNRRRFLLRNLSQWNGLSCQVLVLDGSDEPLLDDILAQFKANIHYFHLPISLSARLGKAIKLITTEYSILHGDDEYLLKSGLIDCIAALDNDPELSCVSGQCIGFRQGAGVVEGFDVYKRLRTYSLQNESAIERIIQHLGNYVPSHIYSVSRSDAWKHAFDCLSTQEIPVYAIGELQVEICLSYSGKSRSIPSLTWLRSIDEAPPIRNTKADPSLDETKKFYSWWNNVQSKDQREAFLERMSDTLIKIRPFDRGQLNQCLIEACTVYARNVQDRTQGRAMVMYRPIAPGLKYFHRLLRNVFHVKLIKRPSLMAKARNLENLGIQVDIEELEKIEKDILAFHSEKFLK